MVKDTSKKLGVGSIAALLTVTFPVVSVVAGRPGLPFWNLMLPLPKFVISTLWDISSSFAMGCFLSSGKGTATFSVQRAVQLVGWIVMGLPDRIILRLLFGSRQDMCCDGVGISTFGLSSGLPKGAGHAESGCRGPSRS